MEIQRNGAMPSRPGQAEYFTGSVRLDASFKRDDPARVGGLTVTFEPGARTNWHTHPLGQTLIVLSGIGRVQRAGGPVHEIRPGDIVWFEPGERHWHGAAPDVAMSHLAIAEALDGVTVDWQEPVLDAEYAAPVG
ncbi:MAG: cupin domain-containing protein [Rhodobacteraceae bacterium]|jgi:quercetin dioxygenase-like cupin family protein|nr:cupin domain-containing protein [Planctomycetota bacterium]MCB1405613.1 cupin domain-containing protein [Paracoccaceae bacterium]